MNIGNTPPERVPAAVRDIMLDAAAQAQHAAYPADEIAVRLHHRLVWVHPFRNGNGRVTRKIADIQIAQLGGKRFSWGGLTTRASLRPDYMEALRAADKKDIGPLLAFARS